MSSAERSHISNGIWLCATCADLIDKDEIRFSVDSLRLIKAEHERSRRIGSFSGQSEGDIIAVGPSIIAVGEILRTGSTGIRVRLAHFVEGAERDLFSFAEGYDRFPEKDRYILLSELGYGNQLEHVPTVERVNGLLEIEFVLKEHLTRVNATTEIHTICAHTGKMISGMDAFVQNFERTLRMARGTWFANLESGSDLSDLYWRYEGSPWFARLAMKEMIRLSCLPIFRRGAEASATPFACVNRVNRVEVPTFVLTDQKLSINVEFDLEGLGLWSGALSVFISTLKQLEQSRSNAQFNANKIAEIETTYSAYQSIRPT